MADKSADNLIAGIEKSKKIPFESILYALGIRFVGETVAKKLAREYKSIDALKDASVQELILVDEIGIKIAESVAEFFKNVENVKIVDRLKNYGVKMEISEIEKKNLTDKLKGYIFVISGAFESISRDELKNLIESNGGKVASAISSKTNYVVAGNNMGPKKKEKALKLGVSIISEEDFMRML